MGYFASFILIRLYGFTDFKCIDMMTDQIVEGIVIVIINS